MTMTSAILETSAPDQPDMAWNLARRVAFRFIFLYTLLYSRRTRVNAEPTPYDKLARVVLRGGLATVLPDLVGAG